MSDESSSSANNPERSTADNVRDLADASKQLLEAGKQVTDNLAELSRRVEHAGDIGSRLVKSPWLLAGGAFAAGILILTLSRKQ